MEERIIHIEIEGEERAELARKVNEGASTSSIFFNFLDFSINSRC